MDMDSDGDVLLRRQFKSKALWGKTGLLPLLEKYDADAKKRARKEELREDAERKRERQAFESEAGPSGTSGKRARRG